MARMPRLAIAGELHLVSLHGQGPQPVFVDDADRRAFTGFLHQAASEQAVAVHAYALLDQRVLLALTPRQAHSIGRLMQSLGRRYVAAFNRRHGRRGSLWDGRFRSSVLDARTLLMDVIAYVEKAPAVEGLATSAAEWPWSSAAHHCGQRRDPLVADHPAYWRLGNTPFEREHAHTILLSQPSLEAERRIEEAVRGGAVIGAADFRARISEATGRPTAPRPRGRPPSKKTVPI